MRRALKIVAIVIAVPILGLAVAVLVLRATNPSPAASSGWDRVADMPDPRSEVAAAAEGERLVVAGGFAGFGTAKAVSIFEVGLGRWRAAPEIPEPRHHAAAATLGGQVHFAGGASSLTDWTPHDDIWRFRTDHGWEPLRDMPEGRQGHAMVALGGRLYVVGGVGETSRVLVYDPDTGWTTGAAMSGPRDHLRAVVFRDEVWALGGRSGEPLDRVDVYDPASDAWRPGPPLPVAMSAMAVGVVDGRIHVVGGEDPHLFGGGVMERHVVYDGERWRNAADPILAVHGAGGDVVEGRLYVAGGASRQGALSLISRTGVTQVFGPESD